MARRTRPAQRLSEEDLDEVDVFSRDREKVFLDDAGQYGKSRDESEESEEEVMGLGDGSESEAEDDDGAEFFEKPQEEAENEDETWGGRANYYGADEVDDGENAKRIEEEALRQQKKHLEELDMNDYLDEDVMEEWQKAKTEEKPKDILNNDIPKVDLASMDSKSKMELLKNSYPEFIPLSIELSTLHPKLEKLKASKDKSPSLHAKFVALSAYLGTVSSYFAIFLANLETGESFSLRDHPVMEGILTCREVWRQASILPDHIDELGDQDMEDISAEALSDDEGIMGSEEEEQQQSEIESEEEEEPENDGEFNIDITTKRKIKNRSVKGNDFVGDLADVDAEEKKARRRTLRFYTSKIDQAANKNDARYTGDMDLPYKERLFERQQRLMEEARKRGQSDTRGDALDQNDFNSDDERDAKTVNNEFDESYYSELKQSKTDKRVNRTKAHEDAVKAAKEGKLAELQEAMGDDGKRAVNYQILKNKGLTPHRKKEDRNARVKKRKKYEKAQKKLKSVRAVFKENSGPYQGETTGIKKGISRSVKLV